MTYNIENAFDTYHDEGKDDLDFCEGGSKKWSKSRLFKKLHGVCKTIVAADEERPIDLIALCEVENDTVMEYLTHRTPLNRLGYQYIMTHSDDARGIDIALLYSFFTFHPIETQHIHIAAHTPRHPIRDILHVAGTIANGDTLDVYVLHLPSKLGGAVARKGGLTAARMLKENVDSIHAIRLHPNIIIMGDFNAETKSSQIKMLTSDGILKDHAAPLHPGTYKYKGDWSTIDHILTHTTTLLPQYANILTLPFLIEPDETYGGYKPHRTYLGPIYKGGISDHLPIMMRFEIQQK
ncbi:MAG: endonuclease [Prevotellaceae bacterium]|nr:endonuclease [Prevotellaceae bacterium]